MNTITTQEVMQLLKNFTVNKDEKSIDFEYCDNGFSLYMTKDESTDLSISFTADIQTKDLLSGECIVGFTNVVLDKIEVDTVFRTYTLPLSDTTELLSLGKEIAVNASYYKLVGNEIITTDDVDATYSEMSENYEKYGY